MSHRRKCRDGDSYTCAISESSDFYSLTDSYGPSEGGTFTLGTVLAIEA